MLFGKSEYFFKSAAEGSTRTSLEYLKLVFNKCFFKAIEIAVDVYTRKNTKISTSELNDKFLPIIEATPPPSYKGKYVKIKYITQLPTAVPSYAFFCNLPQYVKDPYKRFIENKFRDMYKFNGVPIRIYFRKK